MATCCSSARSSRARTSARLLDAYEALAPRSIAIVPPLVLAGHGTTDERERLARAHHRPPLAGHVRHIGYVEPERPPDAVPGARLLVQPSFEEGFGLPVLEAMTVGVPVVAANRGALPEVSATPALLVDPDDPDALAAAIERMLDDDGSSRRLCGDGRARCARRLVWTRRATARAAPTHAAIARRSSDEGGLTMRIGIDARELCGQPTGVGRYLAGLLDRMGGGRRRATARVRPLRAGAARRHTGRPPRLPLRLVAGGNGGTRWEQRYDCRRGCARPSRRLLRARLHRAAALARADWSWRSTTCRSPRTRNGFRPREGLRRRWLTRRSASARARGHRRSPSSRSARSSSACGVAGSARPCHPARRSAHRPASPAGNATARETSRALRRLDLQPPARARSDSRLRAAGTAAPDASLDLVGDNRSYPHEDIAAPIASPALPAADPVAPLRARRRAARALRSRARLRVSVRVRRARADAARSAAAGCRRSCSTRRSPARAAATPRSTCRTGDVGAPSPRRSTTLLFDDPARGSALLAAAPDVLARYNWPHGGARDAAPCIETLPRDRSLDRHRQLQRPRRSRALPRSRCTTAPPAIAARNHRRRQRLERRQRRCGPALDGVRVIDAAGKRRLRARQQHRHPRQSRRLMLLLNSDTRRAPAAIDRLVASSSAHPDVGGRRTTAGRRRGPRRAVVRR